MNSWIHHDTRLTLRKGATSVWGETTAIMTLTLTITLQTGLILTAKIVARLSKHGPNYVSSTWKKFHVNIVNKLRLFEGSVQQKS